MIENKPVLRLPPTRPEPVTETKTEAVKCSYFARHVSNTVPNRTMTIQEVYLDILSTRNQYQTDMLRKIGNEKTARNYKAHNFNSVTFSGTFSKRCEAGLIQHSGLLCIDFDHVGDIDKLKANLLQDNFFETVLMFISPSGDGLKWVVKVNTSEHSHLNWFKAIANYLSINYEIAIDPSGKDVSRCCFLPYDPMVYINPEYIKK